jgi:hypothetical protein
VGHSGSITRLTRKCFCLAKGLIAVHLLNSNFLGFSGFAARLYRSSPGAGGGLLNIALN